MAERKGGKFLWPTAHMGPGQSFGEGGLASSTREGGNFCKQKRGGSWKEEKGVVVRKSAQTPQGFLQIFPTPKPEENCFRTRAKGKSCYYFFFVFSGDSYVDPCVANSATSGTGGNVREASYLSLHTLDDARFFLSPSFHRL